MFVWLPCIWLLLHRLWGDHHGWGLQRRKHLCDNHWLWGHYPWQVCFALIKHDPTNRCLARMCVALHLVSPRELRKFYFRFQFTVIILLVVLRWNRWKKFQERFLKQFQQLFAQWWGHFWFQQGSNKSNLLHLEALMSLSCLGLLELICLSNTKIVVYCARFTCACYFLCSYLQSKCRMFASGQIAISANTVLAPPCYEMPLFIILSILDVEYQLVF